MRSSNPAVPSPRRPGSEESVHPHSWLRTLEVFDIPFLIYTRDGARHHVSPAAAKLLTRVSVGLCVGRQADQIVAEELSEATPHLQIGQFALVREVPASIGGMVLGVHLARPPIGDISAVVVIRPDTSQAEHEGGILGLSRRESDVARLIASGLATKEIAHRLGISTHTTRHHTERVFAKLGVRTRAGVAALLGGRMGASSPVRDAGSSQS
jgi:DNA-binding CsgD family transcriptional regulator